MAENKRRNLDGESTTIIDSSSSSSKSITETVDGSHRYVIKGYSLAKGMGIGKYLSSDVFTIGGYDWAIYFYPDGKNPEDNSGYVSVFIALASDGTDVRALFELSMMDQTENGKHKVHSHFERQLDSGPYTLKYRGSMWGYKRFFKRATLESSDFLKDDSLIINCKVGVVRTRKEGPKQYNVPMPPSDMGQNFKGILESGIGSDITFEVGEETIRAHKLILAARSPVFKAQFFGNWALSPSMDKVVVEDIEPAVFKAMLQFMYGDELAELHEIVPESILVQHLLAAADRYGMDRLKLLCEAKLCQEVTTETVATTLALAEQHHCSQLKSVCLKFAAGPGNLGEMMKSEGFKHLEQSCPSMLSELLQAIAVIEENDLSGGGSSQQQQASKKRSSSSNIGLNIYNHLVVDPNNPNNAAAAAGRRMRRRL